MYINPTHKMPIEKIVLNKFYEYLVRHELFSDTQSGFRPCHSTALLNVTNDWYSIDNGILNGVLFLGLKKAFDTVDHEILLQNSNSMERISSA